MPRIRNSTSPKPTAEQAAAAARDSLVELTSIASNFQTLASNLAALQAQGYFRYLSKRSRNKFLADLLKNSREIEAAAKGTFKVLKKVKRERVPDAHTDTLLSNQATKISEIPAP